MLELTGSLDLRRVRFCAQASIVTISSSDAQRYLEEEEVVNGLDASKTSEVQQYLRMSTMPDRADALRPYKPGDRLLVAIFLGYGLDGPGFDFVLVSLNESFAEANVVAEVESFLRSVR